MDPKQQQHSQPKSTERKGSQPSGDKIGGREFGQVIEPMQAQMASENEGLAETNAEKTTPARTSPRKTRKAA